MDALIFDDTVYTHLNIFQYTLENCWFNNEIIG